jgi:hypothetical protein
MIRDLPIVETGESGESNDTVLLHWTIIGVQFWEMLSLTKPYPHYTAEDHKVAVCQGDERPELCSQRHIRIIDPCICHTPDLATKIRL